MKKFSFWLVTSIITFGMGLGASTVYYLSFYESTDVAAEYESVIVEKQIDCKRSEAFPGFSSQISNLKKGKSGYFPLRTFADEWENSDSFHNDWYGKHLSAMKQESLLDTSDENKEVYRFLWLRTFDHPVFVRAERDGYSFKMVSRELDGAGGYEPGKILRTDTRLLERNEWCELVRILDETRYWQMSSHQRDDSGNDGAQWILEGVKNNRYHIVDRWSPNAGKYREACVFLLQLSGRDVASLKNDLY